MEQSAASPGLGAGFGDEAEGIAMRTGGERKQRGVGVGGEMADSP
jgi:hypothetical protein